MQIAVSHLLQNSLLASLSHAHKQQFLPYCELVPLNFAEDLAQQNQHAEFAWFPISGFISLTIPMEDHGSLEVGMVGDEGMLGVSLILGVNTSPLHAIVQGEGMAIRIKAKHFQTQLAQFAEFKTTLQHYLQVMMIQSAQMTACTRFHLIEARLARWLLMTRDRAHSDCFKITQEFLAYMLGVRRVGVTRAASSLQDQKFITYRRGDMQITDPDGLAAIACSCYETDKLNYAKLLPVVKLVTFRTLKNRD